LAKVVRARERVRDRHAAETAAAERKEEVARSREADLERRETVFLAGIEEVVRSPISANVLIELDRQRRLWSASVEMASRAVAEHAVETERRRAGLREAAVSLRASERAQENMVAREQRERDRQEQRASDDLSAARRPR
jgi:flagellar export protein FliJ